MVAQEVGGPLARRIKTGLGLENVRLRLSVKWITVTRT
jgi:hypothetical protein